MLTRWRQCWTMLGSTTLLFVMANGGSLAIGNSKIGSANRLPTSKAAISSLAFRPDGKEIAIGRFRSVSFTASVGSKVTALCGCIGYVSSLAYSPDGKLLLAGCGLPGRSGEVLVYNSATHLVAATLIGPEDVVQSVSVSPDGKVIAGGSYDRSVYLWRLPTRLNSHVPIKPIRRLTDHTDAVYCVAFSPTGARLASAAGDRTVKVWDSYTGKRLLTLSESTGELYGVAFRAGSDEVAAGGADRVLRVWNAQTGEMLRSAFAHNGPILRVLYGHAGRSMFTTGVDGAVKQWSADTLQEKSMFPVQTGWPQALSISNDDRSIVVGCLDGSLHGYNLQRSTASIRPRAFEVDSKAQICNSGSEDVPVAARMAAVVKRIPGNETFRTAQFLTTPCTVSGELWDGHAESPTQPLSHYYRFHAIPGKPVIIEVNARRSGSPLDSYLQILDRAGKPVEQAVLRSMGQSEITLFDKDSLITGIRLLPFPDLRLNDYVLIGRELLRVGTLPKGPDDDTQFRSIHGQRVGYLCTNPEYHSIGTKVYRVELHPAGSTFSPNGMPLTHLMYENDDGGPLYGRDSYIRFEPPVEGDYTVCLSDARSQQGKGYGYRLEIHPPQPNFTISINPAAITVPANGSAAVNIECDRFDGFEGPIHVSLEGLPSGYNATESDIEEGETAASLLVSLTAKSVETAPGGSFKVIARAMLPDGLVTREPAEDKNRKVTAGSPSQVYGTVDTTGITLRPGHEVTFVATISRKAGFTARVPLDVRNLPFGVKVMDVGLNGILVNEKETSRRIVLSCEPWVKPQVRQIFVYAGVEGGIGTGIPAVTLKITK